MNGLTARQAQVLDFLRTYIADHGYPPSFEDIAKNFGFTKGGSRDHLAALERKGFIRRDHGNSRTMKIVGGGPTPETSLPSSLDIRRPPGATPLLGPILVPIYTPESLAAAVRDETFLAAHAFPRNQDRPVPYAVAQKTDAPVGAEASEEHTNEVTVTVTGGPGEPH